MPKPITPHLKWPFRWGANGHAEVVEQGDSDDIVQRAFAILNTRRGFRIDLPEFGLRPQVLQENGPSLDEIKAALDEWLPETGVELSDKQLEDLKSKLVNVGVKVTTDAG